MLISARLSTWFMRQNACLVSRGNGNKLSKGKSD